MNSWKRKLRMGMVGGGEGALIGGVHRIAAELDQQIELVAGCFSSDPENTRRTGEGLYLDPSRCYSTYVEMAEIEADLPKDERIDFVSIVTPNNLHYPVSKKFLKAGFHVVCDKPMTYTLEEAVELVDLVEETGLVFALTHNYTGYPLIRHARHLFTSGELGAVRKVIVEYLQQWLMVSQEKCGNKQAVWRTDPSQSGIGGSLGDIGVHCFNLVEYVTGDLIQELCADKSTFLPDRRLDEDVNALLRLEGGGKGVLSISQVATGEDNGLTLRVYAEKGALLWKQEQPNELQFYQYGKPRQILSRAHAYLSDMAKDSTRVPPGHPEGFIEAFATIYNGASKAIRAHLDGLSLTVDNYDFPTVYDGLRGMEFITKAVESSENGSIWVGI